MRLGRFSSLLSVVSMAMALFSVGCGDEVETPLRPGETEWVRRIGRTSEPEVMAIAGYPAGGVLVAGRYFGEISFGGSVLPSPANNFQIVLARYDEEGRHVYSKSFGQEASERINDVAMLPDGSALCVGTFSWKIDFGLGEMLTQGADDIFVMKIDPTGKPLWVKQLGGQGLQSGQAIAVFPDASFVITGRTGGPVDFLENVPITPDSMGFVLRLDKDGNPLWGRVVPELQHTPITDVAARPDGGVVIAGTFYNSVSLGGPSPLFANQYQDGFVAAYDKSGKWLWERAVGGGGFSDNVNAVVVRPNGNVLMTGNVEGSVDLGGGVVAGIGNDPSSFLLELDSLGKHVDSKIFGLSGYDWGGDIAIAPDGSFAITGLFRGNLSFGKDLLTSSGEGDAFVAKFSPSGQLRFQAKFGAAGDEGGYRVAFDGKGNVLVSGSVNGEVDFGLGPTTGSGYDETFIVSLAP